MIAIAKVSAGAAVKDLSPGGSWRRLNNHAAPLMKKMVAIAKVSAGAAVKDLSPRGSWRGLNNHAAPLMGRAYINERATRRSGYIPSMWRGVGRRSSFGTFLQRKVVKTLHSSRRRKINL